MTASGPAEREPLRIAVFSHGTEAPPAAHAYREELELFLRQGLDEVTPLPLTLAQLRSFA